MISLIKIEWTKMRGRKLIFAALIICSIAIIAFGFFLKQDTSNFESSADITDEEQKLQDDYQNSADWKEQMKIQMKMNEFLGDIYGEEEIKVKNDILQYRIDHDLEPFEKNTTWDFIAYAFEIIGFLVSVFAILFAIEIVISEYTYKTAKLLFAKPFTRTKIIVAKYVTSILFMLGLAVFFFVISLVVGGIFFTFKGGTINTAIKFYHKIYECTLYSMSLIQFGATILKSFHVMTIAFFLSILCKNQVAPMITSLGILFFGNMIAEKLYAINFKGIRFSILANLSISSFIDCPVKKEYSFFLFLLVGIIHVIAFIWGSIQLINRADI